MNYYINIYDYNDAFVSRLQAYNVSFQLTRFGYLDNMTFSIAKKVEDELGLNLNYKCTLYINDTPVASGFVNTISSSLKNVDEKNITCNGYIKQLNYIKISKVYKNVDVSDIVKDIIDFCATKRGFRIDATNSMYHKSGFIVDEFVVENQNALEVINTCSVIAGSGGESYSGESLNWNYGVDENMCFYFVPKGSEIVETFVIGRDIESFEYEESQDELKTVVNLYGGQLEDGTNKIFTYLADDITLNAFGYREEDITNTNITTKQVADIYASAILRELLTPSVRANITVLTKKVIRPYGLIKVIFSNGVEKVFAISNIDYTITTNGLVANITLGKARGSMPLLFRKFFYTLNMMQNLQQKNVSKEDKNLANQNYGLVKNGSFEVDGYGRGKPDFWDFVGTTVISTDVSVSGSKSIKFNKAGDALFYAGGVARAMHDGKHFGLIEVNVNNQYRFIVNFATWNTLCYAKLLCFDGNKNYLGERGIMNINTNGSWQKSEIIVSGVGVGNNNFIVTTKYVSIMIVNNSNQIAFVDDIYLLPV